MKVDRNDLNLVAISGRVVGDLLPILNGNLVLSFDLEACKQTRHGAKLSRFKVVLFGELADRWISHIDANDRITVSGELDEAAWSGPTGKQTEIRIVARFIQKSGVGL